MANNIQLQEFPADLRSRVRSNVVPRQADAAKAFEDFISNTRSQLKLWRSYQATNPPADELQETAAIFTANAASLMSPSRVVELAKVLDIIAAGTPNPDTPGEMHTRQTLLALLGAAPPFNPDTDLD